MSVSRVCAPSVAPLLGHEDSLRAFATRTLASKIFCPPPPDWSGQVEPGNPTAFSGLGGRGGRVGVAGPASLASPTNPASLTNSTNSASPASTAGPASLAKQTKKSWPWYKAWGLALAWALLVLFISNLLLMASGSSLQTLAAGVISGQSPTQVNPPPTPNPIGPTNPGPPQNPSPPSIVLEVNGANSTPSTAVVVFLGMTLLSIAPSIMLLMTSFTKIFIVLAMSRNAIGLQQTPPNQVIAGLAVFLSLFIMAPVVTQVYDQAVTPYLDGKVGSFSAALALAEPPLREFMGRYTREEDIALITRAAGRDNPANLNETPFTTLIPAFVISEVRAAFIIGFVVFIPFLVIDLVVAAALMSMGMMMLPPVMVSLPFKILLFVMVDGWGMITETLVGTYR